MAQTKTAPNKTLYFALIATVAATIWVSLNDGAEETSIAEAVVRPANTKPSATVSKTNTSSPPIANKNALVKNKAASPLEIPWHQLDRSQDLASIQDVFKPHSWLVIAPPPPPAPEPPPPPPQAPPVPFVYMGKMVDAQNAGKIFLTQNNKFYYVAKGENVNAEWRFDKEEANVIRLTYLPLNLPQVLSKSVKQAAKPVSTETAFEPN